MNLEDDTAKKTIDDLTQQNTQQVATRKGKVLLKQLSIKYPNFSHDRFCQKEARIKIYFSYILSDQDERTIRIAQLRSSYYSYEL